MAMVKDMEERNTRCLNHHQKHDTTVLQEARRLQSGWTWGANGRRLAWERLSPTRSSLLD